MKSKHLYTIDAILVMISAIGILMLVGYSTPNVIAPLDGSEIDSTKILFSIENAEYIILSEDKDFTYPKIYSVEDGLSITLQPGFYYWKAKGVTETKINTFTIRDAVILELVEKDGEYLLINGGTKGMKVEVYNETDLVDEFNLMTNEEAAADGTKFIGGEK